MTEGSTGATPHERTSGGVAETVQAPRAMTPARLVPWALLILGFTLRLAISIRVPNVHWGDEIFEVMEPAHRLVFGTGIVTWEWMVGIRSWLLPGVFAAFMAVGRALGETDPALINLPGEVMMAALGCLPVLCAYGWGRNLYGVLGGLVAGLATMVWSDLVYMSPHTFNEVVAADLLPVALYLGHPYTPGPMPGSRRLFWSGFVLGLTFALRFHLGPALLVAAIAICGRQGRAWQCLIMGAVLPILALGILDWITLGRPLQSIWLNIWYNEFADVSQEFGTSPWWLLLAIIGIVWWPVLPILLVAGYCGARRMPGVMLVAATILATHALIGHKEYRFVYPALPILITLAGIGTAAIVDRLHRRLPGRSTALLATAAAILLWLGMSFVIATRPFMTPSWTREAGYFGAYDEINRLPQVCAVATNHALASPGNSWLRPNLPLYQINLVDIPPEKFSRAADSFNAIAASPLVHIKDPRFRRLGCHDGNVDAQGGVHLRICVWIRPGGCDVRAAPPQEPNWPDALRRRMGLPPFDWTLTFTEAGP